MDNNCYPKLPEIVSENDEKASPEVMETLKTLMERDYSDHTKRALFLDIREFVRWYEWEYGERFTFGRIIRQDIIDFRESLKRIGRAVATINRKLASLRLFFEMAVELEYIKKNPVQGVKSLPSQSLSPKWLTHQETRRFMKEVEIRDNIRDKAVIGLMLYAGLRVGEVVRLRDNQVHIAQRSGHVLIAHSKGGKTRKVPLVSHLREILTEYQSRRKQKPAWYEEPLYLFPWRNWPMMDITVTKICKKYSELSSVPVHPHRLRHTFAYAYLASNPWDLVGLAQIMGHSDINTTSIYTQNRLEDLQERVENMPV
jgi:site-specific recombinase XerD